MRILPALAFVATVLSRKVLALNDGDILSFALNLECLEAEFYSYAAYGKSIGQNLLQRDPMDTVGGKMAKAGKFTDLAQEIADDEIAHVNFLRVAGLTLPCPKIDIGASFSALANAALGRTDVVFDPYASKLNFALGAFVFEDVGVTAYHAALPLIENMAYLDAASGIMAIEAYHAGIIRRILIENMNEEVTGIDGVSVKQLANAISAIRAAVGNGAETPLTMGKKKKLMEMTVANDANSIAYNRAPADVLKIVYLGGTSMGGFFPEGLTGTITSA